MTIRINGSAGFAARLGLLAVVAVLGLFNVQYHSQFFPPSGVEFGVADAARWLAAALLLGVVFGTLILVAGFTASKLTAYRFGRASAVPAYFWGLLVAMFVVLWTVPAGI
jgi:hypothetical protein